MIWWLALILCLIFTAIAIGSGLITQYLYRKQDDWWVGYIAATILGIVFAACFFTMMLVNLVH